MTKVCVLDDIQDGEHDGFWDKSEDDQGECEESEGDVETCWDKHDDESGEESLDHVAKGIADYSASVGVGRNNDKVIDSASLNVKGETHLNSKEVQEGEVLLQKIGWMTPLKTTTTTTMTETNTEPTNQGRETVNELKVTDQKVWPHQ